MTSKPSRKDIKDNYSMIPYAAVYLATWGATILSRTPTWVHRPILRMVNYIIHMTRETLN